jgi:hypothetical protein
MGVFIKTRLESTNALNSSTKPITIAVFVSMNQKQTIVILLILIFSFASQSYRRWGCIKEGKEESSRESLSGTIAIAIAIAIGIAGIRIRIRIRIRIPVDCQLATSSN